MQTFNLLERFNLRAVKGLNFLKPRELCYVRVISLVDLTAIDAGVISEAAKHSSMTFVSFPIEEINQAEKVRAVIQLGIRGFALRASYDDKKFLHHDRRGPERSGDLDLIAKVEQFRREYPDVEVVVEFQLRPDLRILAPTIARLYEEGMRWVVLNAEGVPDKLRTSSFREVFEYLRIRSCNYLNVYFPFWNPEFREWDIKTQNTFSGLFEVHIDISNRCTHSCTFCGLYGPAAIEDIKKDNGGKLSPQVNEFMKMEIDSEHCHRIIESLPWSVRLVQFGGAGDPLMHRDAVKFIGAVRSRGFRVSVLSNMEYLGEEDILELHRLSGRKDELHFIANVSAGTPELYVETRPRQTEKTFERVVSVLDRFSTLRETSTDGRGVYFTVMCVVTSINCRSLLDVAKLSVKLRAQKLWFKPMELHANFQAPLVPSGDTMMRDMARSLKAAADYALAHGVELEQQEYCDQIFERYLGEMHV